MRRYTDPNGTHVIDNGDGPVEPGKHWYIFIALSWKPVGRFYISRQGFGLGWIFGLRYTV